MCITNHEQSVSEKLSDELNRDMDEMHRLANKASDLSLKNYSTWRDYLHKYYLVMLAIAGGLGIYQDGNRSSLILIVIGVLIGFLTINLYLYWERKHIRFSYDIDITKPYKFFNHSDIKESDPPLALRLNLRDVIEANRKLLKESSNKEESKILKGKINADKRWLSMIKYWNMYGFDPFWITGVIISLLLTFLGLILIIS
ncbi:MAG: hypothetical protein PHE20_01455 [Patescibacteria group bacterium]|nr:hypothetical protein [Patescibacteria group bacterium]